MSLAYEDAPPPTARVQRISWGSIIAGIAVALGIQMLLSLLGIGIGASTIHPTSSQSATPQGIGIGSSIWFVVSAMISLFFGGWAAAKLAGIPRPADGVLHGIVVWSVTTLLTLWLVSTTLGGIISGASGMLGGLFQAAGSGISAAAPAVSNAVGAQVKQSGVTPDDVMTKINQLLSSTGDRNLSPQNLRAKGRHDANLSKNAARNAAFNPANAKQQYNALVYRFAHDAPGQSRERDRQDLINAVMSQQHVSRAQATRTVDEWGNELDQADQQMKNFTNTAEQQAKQAGDTAAADVSKAAFGAFVLFLLGAVAAALGSFVAVRALVRENHASLHSSGGRRAVRGGGSTSGVGA